MTQKEFSSIAGTIPLQPGIYKYFDADSELLYVGKAKSLRKRVSSYFSKTIDNAKTRELVKRITKIEFTIVNDEQDAFLLENSLIKQFQPVFNINLKDDKTYPYIVIKNEPFPRVFFTRKKINDGSKYFGPYTSVENAKELLAFIKQTVLLRTCKLNLTSRNIEKKKFKVCLEYHLGNCKGPCEGLQSAEDYNDGLQQLESILKGNLQPVIQHYKVLMQEYVQLLEFEKAAQIKNKIDYLYQYKAKSTIVNNNIGDVDVFSILEEGDTAYVNYLAISNGTIVQTKTTILKKNLDEPASDVLIFAIAQIRNTFSSTTKEIIVPFLIDYPEKDIIITVPKAGDKKKLLELSEKNVNYFKEELRRKKILHVESKTSEEMNSILSQIQKDLHLSSLPSHIECFDNSNFQGSYPVSAMVCFKNGLPSKNDYRKFNVKTVEGINDFATMTEAVYRHYKRVLEEKNPIPQLVIIDGGKGQLSAAMQSINSLGLAGKTTVVGLAKNEEEIFFPGDSQSIKLAWDNEGLKLIRRIRDEVHRFGITFHRNQRSKGTFKNELEQVAGVGKSTIDTLLKKYKSVKKIKLLTEAELADTIGASKAGILFAGLHKI
ncbi:excinuclease ABC subunit UvrC [Ferruginibacter lapsinanis]|uniref:excinuclease ABC subunit UvrC n=1 Tax=Ferruginibacter lapsinanis TaxID=563172 RepID=UPI001E570460|nr:excinuclease ABC subunit UvrC [Ferruginibacter lapsinanis]UEG51160.1 excinuclease ABC subunit UvrC [Ferruginibacter lapsinanis]